MKARSGPLWLRERLRASLGTWPLRSPRSATSGPPWKRPSGRWASTVPKTCARWGRIEAYARLLGAGHRPHFIALLRDRVWVFREGPGTTARARRRPRFRARFDRLKAAVRAEPRPPPRTHPRRDRPRRTASADDLDACEEIGDLVGGGVGRRRTRRTEFLADAFGELRPGSCLRRHRRGSWPP